MIFNGLKNEQKPSLGWLVGSSYLLAAYNRKLLLILLIAFGYMLLLFVFYNVLFMTGYIPLRG